MAIHSCRVVEATKKHQKSQYLNVLNHETEKERKYVVFASNNIIQEMNMTFSTCKQKTGNRENDTKKDTGYIHGFLLLSLIPLVMILFIF